MPPPTHLRLTYSGTYGSPSAASEIWSFSVALARGDGPFSGTVTKTALTTEAAILAGYFNSLSPRMAGVLWLTRTRLAVIGDNGLTVRDSGGAYLQGDAATQLATSGVRTLPNQVALAITLLTSSPGPTGKGRFFLPAPLTGTLDADGRLSDGVRDTFSAAGRSFVNEINAQGVRAGYGPVSIASGGSPTKAIAPGIRAVTGVGVGRVLDTMRSRRSSLLEERELVPL